MPKGKKYFEDLVSYWKAMPKLGEKLPQKTAFSPMQVYQMLPNLFFGERVEKYNIRLRLMGEAVEAATRDMLPNRNIFDMLPEAAWDHAEHYYDKLFGHPCAGHVTRSMILESGLVYDLETISLPLADASGEARYVVGLANFLQNRDNSVLAHRGALGDNPVSLMEYWDLGYGTPPFEESKSIKRVS